MKRVIKLVIKVLEDRQTLPYMCDIAVNLYYYDIITSDELRKFKRLIYEHKPEDAGDLFWYNYNEYQKRIKFLKYLLTKI